MSKELSAIRQIRLGDELRNWRLENNKTLADATAGLKGWNPARLSRIERAHQPISAADLKILLDHYGITGQERADLEGLLSAGPTRRWWRSLDFADSITAAFAEYLDLEADASHISEYFPAAFPGLLQTEGYAAEMIAASLSAPNDEQIEAATEVRLRRQSRLTDGQPLKFDAYFGEVALLVAGDQRVLADQIRHVIKVAQYPNITVKMVPLSAGRPGILASGVVLMRFPGDPDGGFVFIEAVGGMLPRRTGRDVRRAERAFARVERCALSPEETITVLERKLEELT
ncbi:helix-turn-helix domain-containing protein [Kitasatospora cathayae]|uniref:Helix-turn-helix transcriptional regulator n=1 Tax=Kitasatospora cathayae TaxID=3004092 RepID=A0ABY7QB24_9ACTN|nr:helix-turn-helix transcriptional regulator [Kitasatospora sp. HUAS 3-15]WBP89938.1 helix-turn-helix transcriptional regulator [Kitasatospora sp. HUAS 3-15]